MSAEVKITFSELRQIKHQLPQGSVKRIANELNIPEQTVRNYFGAKKFQDQRITGWHLQPGPRGGIVKINDSKILELAKNIISQEKAKAFQLN